MTYGPIGSVPIAVDINVHNLVPVIRRSSKFTKGLRATIRKSLVDYYNLDFKPMLKKVLSGFRAFDVPSKNAEPWASKKAIYHGISHSLGRVTGQMQDDAMGVEPRIRSLRTRTSINANFGNVPRSDYPYLVVVHEGLDKLHKAYPMVEAARIMTHRKLINRLESNISKTWMTGG